MGMNDTPSGERVHIGFFGRRNAGKSCFMNMANTMIMNITTKKQEYGVLQAVGMTNKQLNL